MGAFGRSFALARASLRVLLTDTELAAFTALAAVCTVVASLLFIAPAIAVARLSGAAQTAGGLVVLYLFYAVTSFIAMFFNTALAGAALKRLRGGEATMADGWAVAGRNASAILGYSLISATVGVLLYVISEKFEFVGRIVASLLGAAWSIVTFLVVPVIAAEGIGPVDAIKRSGALLRQTWGEQIIGGVGVGAFTFVLLLGALVPLGLGMLLGSPAALVTGVIVAAVYSGLVLLLGSALGQIFRVAVYLYAETGRVGDAFSVDQVQSAFRPK
jgi:hypothetical protein